MAKDESEVPSSKPAAQSFSVAGAREAMEEVVRLLPKTKRLQALGAANEVMVTLDSLWGFIVCDLDVEAQKVAALEPASKALRAFLDRHSPPFTDDEKQVAESSIQ